MKNFKIIPQLLVLILFAHNTVNAQDVKNTMDLLINNKWATTLDIGQDQLIFDTLQFTSIKLIDRSQFENTKSEIILQYYLSDNPDTNFDNSKVGKVINGKYFITRNKYGSVSITEIIRLTEKILEISVVNTKEKSNDSKPKGIITYKAVPKSSE